MTGPSNVTLQTGRLKMRSRTRAEVVAELETLPPHIRSQMSATWLALLEASGPCDPWIHGFTFTFRDGHGNGNENSGGPVGQCGYKGPPDADGTVEIAYMVEADHQGRGYATEAAWALTDYAFSHPEVRMVRAHTAPEPNASTRVLGKCGFRKIGEIIDPEDGLVWRWEKAVGTAREAD